MLSRPDEPIQAVPADQQSAILVPKFSLLLHDPSQAICGLWLSPGALPKQDGWASGFEGISYSAA